MVRIIQVDWTINLIVINSKLSGANSFQSTVQACFGKPGLIAISVNFLLSLSFLPSFLKIQLLNRKKCG